MEAPEIGFGIAALVLGPGGLIVTVQVLKAERTRDREEYKRERDKTEHALSQLWKEIHDAKGEFRKGFGASELDRSEIRGRVKVLEDRK